MSCVSDLHLEYDYSRLLSILLKKSRICDRRFVEAHNPPFGTKVSKNSLQPAFR